MYDCKSTVQNVSIVTTLCFILTLWLLKGSPAPHLIAYYVSHDIGIAILCCVALFIFKCYFTILPTSIIFAACAYLLPICCAFPICILGSGLVFTTAFYSGRKKSKRTSPPPNAENNENNGFISALFLHCIRLVPCSTIGMLLGKSGASFVSSFFGAIIGTIPSIVLTLSIVKQTY